MDSTNFWQQQLTDDSTRLDLRLDPLSAPRSGDELGVDGNASVGEASAMPNRRPYPLDRCMHHLIEAQVERSPEAIALIAPDEGTLTYGELNQQANQLAHYLQALGVGPGDHVAICLRRSLRMIISFLAVLKTGAAYVPIDPTYVPDRQLYMLKDSGAAILLTQADLAIALPKVAATILTIDTLWPEILQQPDTNLSISMPSEQLAYVIYTSGSTGNPKGVMIPHRGMVNHSCAMREHFALTERDRVLQFSSISFDIIIEEVYPTLISGATLILRTEAVATSTQQCLTFIQAHDITVLNLPTAFWHELVNGLALLKTSLPPSVRLVVVGGEKASLVLYRQWRNLVGTAVQWINSYGPTETTVSATYFDPIAADFDPQGDRPIPIGRPIHNVETYVLDEGQQPVPIGDSGELYIGGPGVGVGYLNRPDRTEQQFVPHPFSSDPNARLYRTGDQVRYLPDGTLEYLGRLDFQVKLRGFRIELAGIEQVLEQHPVIQQAIVLMREEVPGQKYLAAYILTAEPQQLPDATLREYLDTRLPAYMMPTTWTLLDAFPMTPNGKVDRKALPIPQRPTGETVLPTTPLEAKLVGIWQEVLGISPIGITDEFLNLGGHSLLAVRICDRIAQVCDQPLPPIALFQAQTIQQLAIQLESEEIVHSAAVLLHAGKPDRDPLFIIHVLGRGFHLARPMLAYLPSDRPVYGLSVELLPESEQPLNSVETLAEFYVKQLQMICPEGPYHLAGISFGGLVAYEMAQQLIQSGYTVGVLTLLDTEGGHDPDSTTTWENLQTHWDMVREKGVGYLWLKASRKGQRIGRNVQHQWMQWYVGLHHKLGRSLPYDLRIWMVEENNRRASDSYQPQPYPGAITFLRATEEPCSDRFLELGLGWGDRALGGFTRYDIPGEHLSMLQEPNVAIVGRSLADALAKWDAK